MRRGKIIVLFLMIVMQSSFAQITKFTPAEKLAELLSQFTTFQAQFQQTTTDMQNSVLQHSEGEVMLMRPGKFRWETHVPTHQIVITDGKVVWVYDVDLKQATQQTLQKSAISPAKLLSGNISDLTNQFHVRMVPHKSVLVFQLTPKTPNKQFRSISIGFKHDKLSDMQIENRMNQVSSFEFTRVKLNVSLSSSLFQFKAPAGVDVLH